MILVFVLVLLPVLPEKAKAQDTGTAALQEVAIFTIGGAVGGAFLGVAVWLVDPYAPGANLRRATLVGLGIGTFIGVLFGGFQLTRQAVLPNQQQMAPPQNLYQGRLYFREDEESFATNDRSLDRKREELAVIVPVYQWKF